MGTVLKAYVIAVEEKFILSSLANREHFWSYATPQFTANSKYSYFHIAVF